MGSELEESKTTSFCTTHGNTETQSPVFDPVQAEIPLRCTLHAVRAAHVLEQAGIA